MAPQPANRTVHTRNAFTLVEMLVVIVIICILAALLMPVLSGAYRTAMKSADAALIHQIAMGCETYNQAFHEYPPSGWSYDPAPAVANDPANVWPPPGSVPPNALDLGSVMPGWPDDTRLRLVGSAKLYSFLSGFNAIGCWDPANVFNWNPAEWNKVGHCGAFTSRGILVHSNPADGTVTEDKVYGPYYNPDEKGQTWATVDWGTDTARKAQQKVFASRFQRQNAPRPPAAGGVPETGAPILYYRAAPSPVDQDGNGAVDTWDIYNFRDNFPITDPGNTTFTVAYQSHPLYAPSDGLSVYNKKYDPANWVNPVNQHFGISKPFAKDTSAASAVPTPVMANNSNTFVLISPGPDGEYFTEDDITNFRQ